MTLSCKWPFNTKNERNNASSLPNWISHFFLPLVFPHVSAYKSNLPVHTYPTHIPIISITQDSSGNIWNWACVEVAILNTIFTVQLGFSVHTIPDSSCIQKFPFWRADWKSCGFVCLIHRIRVDESHIREEKIAPDLQIFGYTYGRDLNHTQAALEPLWGRADTLHVSFFLQSQT